MPSPKSLLEHSAFALVQDWWPGKATDVLVPAISILLLLHAFAGFNSFSRVGE